MKNFWRKITNLEWWKFLYKQIKSPYWWRNLWSTVQKRFQLQIERIWASIKNWRKGKSFSGEILPLLLALISSILLFVYWFVAPLLCWEESFFQAVGSTITRNLGWMLGGSIGWYFLYQRTKIADQNLSVERFTRSMEQISNKEYLSVRVGGILGLEQITENQEGRERIMRVLANFIRQNAAKDSEEYKNITLKLMLAKKRSEKDKILDAYRLTRLDIEAAVYALSHISQPPYYPFPLCTLQNTDLRGLQFFQANLSGFQFTNANLSLSWCDNAKFIEANLNDADLSGTALINTNFTKAAMKGSILVGAKLFGTNLFAAKLEDANLTDADFKSVKNLEQHQLDDAFYWENHPPKNLPEGKRPPKTVLPWGQTPDRRRSRTIFDDE